MPVRRVNPPHPSPTSYSAAPAAPATDLRGNRLAAAAATHLAKVGVEGSNPFARSNKNQALSLIPPVRSFSPS
jgi:hypothetical protein